MNLLAFDTACDACSAAIWRDGAIVARRGQSMMRGQSEALVPMIDAVMREARQSFEALSAVAVTIGPGAFTGLRIGLATARAIGLAAGRPVIGISTFEAIAAAARADADAARTLVVAIDTKRDDLYVQRFAFDSSERGFTALGEPAALMPAAAADILPAGAVLLAGDGAHKLLAELGAAAVRVAVARATVPDAAEVAALAALRFKSGVPLPPVRPLYLRAPAARLPHAAGGTPS